MSSIMTNSDSYQMQGWFNIRKSINVTKHINPKHMVIPIDKEKAFNKIQHVFMFKVLEEIGLEEPFFNIIKGIYSCGAGWIHYG